MSARAIRRRGERARRRTAKRAAAAAGAAIGATALLAPSAQAENLVVNSLGDGAADACDSNCTLRDAIARANANSEADAVTFASTLSGTIRLVGPGDGGGTIQINPADALTITDTGPDAITISGDVNNDGINNAGDTRLFDVNATARVTFSGLKLTHGYGSGGGAGAIYINNDAADVTVTGSTLTENGQLGTGGAIRVERGDLTIADSALSGNFSESGGSGGSGGAVSITGANSLTVTGTEFIDNRGAAGGAIAGFGDQVKYGPGSYGPSLAPDVTISGSTFRDNNSTGGGGAIHASAANFEITETRLSGNHAAAGGGAINAAKYSSLTLDEVDVLDNHAGGTSSGGGIAFNGSPGKYDDLDPATSITDTTIVSNSAGNGGGGISVLGVPARNEFHVGRSTIAANLATQDGGGVLVAGSSAGPVQVSDSTISVNGAMRGGGVAVGAGLPTGPGPIELGNSTIAGNVATQNGGGVYLGRYDTNSDPGIEDWERDTVALSSTIVGDNRRQVDAPDDLNSANPADSGGFQLDHSLVEAPVDAAFVGSYADSLLGVDPQLGPLEDNGGPTATRLIAPESPAVDAGVANGLTTDQRGENRTYDREAANAAGGDGTDIGAVELQAPPPPPDATAPRVTVERKPKKKVRTGKRKARVNVFFTADEPGATFECRVDDGDFAPCASPLTAELKSKRGKGKKHAIQVRATDVAGNVGEPATVKLKVIRKRG